MSDHPEHTAEQVEQVTDLVDEFVDRTLNALDVGEDFVDEIGYDQGRIVVDLDGDEDDIALVIGRRGQTLDAIQYLANAVVVNGCEEPIPVYVEAHGYRERRARQLRKQADRAVAQVIRSGSPVELDPMTASERKVIHLYLRDNEEIETESAGTEPNRRLVIHPAD